MNSIDLTLYAVSAWRYSAAYMLCGGGVLGAVGVFVGAKILGAGRNR